MSRNPLLIATALAVVVAGGLAVAKADDLLAFGKMRPAVDDGAVRDRMIAKAAFTEVLAKRSGALGMTPPAGLAPHAPIYPDGMIFYEAEGPGSGRGGRVQYAAAASMRATLDFYEDAAALHHMSFTVTPEGPDAVTFKARDGDRAVQARLTRQFENGTLVDLAYDEGGA